MGLSAIIGKLISKLPPLVKVEVKTPIIINNLTINNDDHSQAVTYNQADKSCVINLGKIGEFQIKDLLTSLVDEEKILLYDKATVELEDFRLQEGVAETKDIISFLTPKIPPEDLNIWRAALYLRGCYKKGMNSEVTRLKFEIAQKYGDKGRNIANLCTAGYLEEWLMPSYDKLKEILNNNEDLVRDRFLKLYNILVNELPFTIFVCHKMSLDDLRQEIDRRKKYGVDFINIHAIGDENIVKIKTVVDEMEKENYTEDKNGHSIFVRIGFKKDQIIPYSESS